MARVRPCCCSTSSSLLTCFTSGSRLKRRRYSCSETRVSAPPAPSAGRGVRVVGCKGVLTYMSVRLTTLSLLRSAARRPSGQCQSEWTQKPDNSSASLAAALLTCQAPLPARQWAPRNSPCRIQLQQRARVRAEQRFTGSHAVPPPGLASALLRLPHRVPQFSPTHIFQLQSIVFN